VQLLAPLEAWRDSETRVGRLARTHHTRVEEFVKDFVPRAGGKLAPLPRA
jgi:hypothetical protein